MSKILTGSISSSIRKHFTVDQTKPGVKFTWGYYFDGVIGGEYAEIETRVYDASNTLIGTGYKLHNYGAAGIFEETDIVYRGTPELNSGDNHSNYGGSPFTAGMEIICEFHFFTGWNGYKFGVNYVSIEMAD